MQPLDAGRQLGREHERLAEAADAIRRGIAAQVAQPDGPCFAVMIGPSYGQPGPQNPQRLAQQVFGQVAHRRADFFVHRMAPVVGRPPQGVDGDVEAAALEGRDLLGDEGLGEPRIPLQYKRDPQISGCA